MLIVRLELWPYGNGADVQDLGDVTIGNDATGTPEVGNYAVVLGEPDGRIRRARVENFDRSKGAWCLVAAALRAALDGAGAETADDTVCLRCGEDWTTGHDCTAALDGAGAETGHHD